MIKPIDKKLYGRNILERNLKEWTGESKEFWVAFAGICNSKILPQVAYENEFEIGGNYPVIELSVENALVKMEMEINLELKEIYTGTLCFDKPKDGRATEALLRQIDLGFNWGFKNLKCWAFGGQSDTTEDKYWRGYLIWADLGFTMIEPDHKNFQKKVATLNRKEDCLQKLLKTEAGYKIWKDEIGDQWTGTFDLTKKSINRRLLQLHIHRSKLKKKRV